MERQMLWILYIVQVHTSKFLISIKNKLKTYLKFLECI